MNGIRLVDGIWLKPAATYSRTCFVNRRTNNPDQQNCVPTLAAKHNIHKILWCVTLMRCWININMIFFPLSIRGSAFSVFAGFFLLLPYKRIYYKSPTPSHWLWDCHQSSYNRMYSNVWKSLSYHINSLIPSFVLVVSAPGAEGWRTGQGWI